MKKSKVQFAIIATIYVVLFTMAAVALYIYDRSQRFKNFQVVMLADYVKKGAMIDPNTKTIVLDSSFQHKPIALEDAIGLFVLDKQFGLRFKDCDLTDEAVALFKQYRSEFSELQFDNCRVVKNQSAVVTIPVGNVLNEPLPKHLAKDQPWPLTQPAGNIP